MNQDVKVVLETARGPHAVWCVIGCGGNYYYAEPRIQVEAFRRGARLVMLVEGDKVEETNWSRQWPGGKSLKAEIANRRWKIPGIKVRRLEMMLRREQLTEVVEELWNIDHRGGRLGDRLLILCLTDNDQARLDAHELADALHMEYTAITVATVGTDLNNGYGAYSIRTPFGWLYDLREKRKDIVPQGAAEQPCGQSPRVNQLCGVLLGEMLDDIHDDTQANPKIREYYWVRDGDAYVVYSKEVQ